MKLFVLSISALFISTFANAGELTITKPEGRQYMEVTKTFHNFDGCSDQTWQLPVISFDHSTYYVARDLTPAAGRETNNLPVPTCAMVIEVLVKFGVQLHGLPESTIKVVIPDWMGEEDFNISFTPLMMQ